MHPLDRRRAGQIAALVAIGLVAVAIGAWRIRPFAEGMVGYDTAASVLYFDRIVAGLRLEGFVEATPKALLTLVDGVTFGLTHDWRAISLLAVAGYGLNVALGTWLAARLGGLAAAGFVLAGLLWSAPLLDDAAYAYAVGPAVTGWLIAGLAVMAQRPRYLVAGAALAVAGLARYETVLLDGLALVALACAWIVPRVRGSVPRTGAAWWLMLGFASVVVEAVHDWLLTGDPLWAIEVSGIVSTFRRVLSVREVTNLIATHYRPGIVVLVLAVVGVVVLVQQRRWAILLGIVALAPGVLAFQVALAVRGTYVSARYLYPADLALVFAAALGVGGIWAYVVQRLPALRTAARWAWPSVAASLAAGLVGLVTVSWFTPLGPVQDHIDTNAAIYANEASVLPTLRTAIAADAAGAAFGPASRDPRNRDRSGAAAVVPVLLIPRLAVDLQLPVTQLADSGLPLVTSSGATPHAGQIVVHEDHLDKPTADYAFLEVGTITSLGAITLDPLLADAGAGIWVLRVGR
jgi:hypothetical protein